ncbi:helix-turn-helix domain-containing protein [Halobacillus litoralis]|uniref:helix-turn-helix domain-containing protein n=1 Tax=Halobacillus litoralis TaxID=45668 RepID=UPI0013716016|nr:helix-turn-helix domain-containing protein [Halobacillus litoralis]MYL39817.1 helix-turn-helix domain-containing protein [Halobacillus litoralis]
MDSVIQFEGTIYENGYGMIAQKVMRDKKLPKQSKLIYAYMCSFAAVDKNGERTAFPSISLQCAELGMTQDTYYKWRKYLVDGGYITIKRQRQEGSRFDKNIYSILAVPVKPDPQGNKEKEPYPKNSGTENPYPKNSSTENPYPKNSSTENPSTENKGTNSNSFNSNSFNNTYKDTLQDTESKNAESSKQKKRDELLKNSLRGKIPDSIHEILSTFTNTFQEMYDWYGVLLRAKDKVAKETDQLILIEDHEEIFHESLMAAIRRIKTDSSIKNLENYLFITIADNLGKYFSKLERSNAKENSSLYYDWLNEDMQ